MIKSKSFIPSFFICTLCLFLTTSCDNPLTDSSDIRNDTTNLFRTKSEKTYTEGSAYYLLTTYTYNSENQLIRENLSTYLTNGVLWRSGYFFTYEYTDGRLLKKFRWSSTANPASDSPERYWIYDYNNQGDIISLKQYDLNNSSANSSYTLASTVNYSYIYANNVITKKTTSPSFGSSSYENYFYEEGRPIKIETWRREGTGPFYLASVYVYEYNNSGLRSKDIYYASKTSYENNGYKFYRLYTYDANNNIIKTEKNEREGDTIIMQPKVFVEYEYELY